LATELTVTELTSDVSFESADNFNGNFFNASGHEIVWVRNTGSSSQTFSITLPDDDSFYNIPAGEEHAIGPLQGVVDLSAGVADIEFAVVNVPNQ